MNATSAVATACLLALACGAPRVAAPSVAPPQPAAPTPATDASATSASPKREAPTSVGAEPLTRLEIVGIVTRRCAFAPYPVRRSGREPLALHLRVHNVGMQPLEFFTTRGCEEPEFVVERRTVDGWEALHDRGCGTGAERCLIGLASSRDVWIPVPDLPSRTRLSFRVATTTEPSRVEMLSTEWRGL